MLLTLFSNYRGGHSVDFLQLMMIFFAYASIILLALPVHEMAHGFMADRMGDPTARYSGRLTLNPLSHLDPIGTLMLFVFGFGYAKPVPVNPRNFRSYRTGMLLTSLAGPLSNLVMGFLSLAVLRLLLFIPLSNTLYTIVYLLLYNFANINVMLFVFNLLPFPPLDGYRVVSCFLPGRWIYTLERNERIFSILLLVFFATGMLGNVLSLLVNPVFNLLTLLTGLR